MTTKEFQILTSIFNKTTKQRFCTLYPKEVSQAKKMYRRVMTLQTNEYIEVYKEKGECNLYRITDKGIKYLRNYPMSLQTIQPATN